MIKFKEKVLNTLLLIPKGKVVTYGDIAKFIGCPKGARAVGNALHNNHNPKKYKCYKVVNQKGELAKNFGIGGWIVQKERLINDGVEVVGKKVDLKKYRYNLEKNNEVHI